MSQVCGVSTASKSRCSLSWSMMHWAGKCTRPRFALSSRRKKYVGIELKICRTQCTELLDHRGCCIHGQAADMLIYDEDSSESVVLEDVDVDCFWIKFGCRWGDMGRGAGLESGR